MKNLHIEIPDELFDQFFRMLPGKGERKAFLITVIKQAIALQAHKDYFASMVLKNSLGEEEKKGGCSCKEP